MKYFLLLVLFLMSVTGFAIELNPYSSHKITVEEWNEYHQRISNELKGSQTYDVSNNTERFVEDLGLHHIVVTFTRMGHKAHPSWITEVMTISNNQLHTRVIGYFAGDQQAFESFYSSKKDQLAEINTHLTH